MTARSPMLVGFNDFVLSATLAGGSWSLPLTYLQDPWPGTKARSENATTGSTQFTIDLASTRNFRMLVLTASNLTSSAQYRITWYSDAFLTAVGNTGLLAIPGYPDYDPDDRGVDICHVFDAVISCRYLKIELSDATNPDGYVEAGRTCVFEAWEPPHNYSPGNADSLIPNTLRTDALGGTGFFNRRKPKRGLRVNWEVMDKSQMDEVRRFRAINGIDKQVFVVPDPDDDDNFNHRNFLATLVDLPEIAELPVDLASFGLQFVEAV